MTPVTVAESLIVPDEPSVDEALSVVACVVVVGVAGVTVKHSTVEPLVGAALAAVVLSFDPE